MSGLRLPRETGKTMKPQIVYEPLQERIIDLVGELRVEVVQFPSMPRRNRVASENKSLAVGFIHKIRGPSPPYVKLEQSTARERLLHRSWWYRLSVRLWLSRSLSSRVSSK